MTRRGFFAALLALPFVGRRRCYDLCSAYPPELVPYLGAREIAGRSGPYVIKLQTSALYGKFVSNAMYGKHAAR